MDIADLTPHLDKLIQHLHPADQNAIRKVIQRNLAKGRVANAVSESDGHDPTPYLRRVISFYQLEKTRVDALFRLKDEAVWDPLVLKMHRWSSSLLKQRNQNFTYAQRTTLSHSAAQETCAVLITLSYPYDTPFEAWVYVILRNLTLAEMRKMLKTAGKEEPVLDESLELFGDPAGVDPERMVINEEQLAALRDAVEALPPRQKSVILDKYLYGLSADEIGKKMGIKANAVYQLLHAARKNLLKNLKHGED